MIKHKLPNLPQVIKLSEDVLRDIYEDMNADLEISLEQSGLFSVEQ